VCWLATHWTPWYAYTHVNLLSCDSQNIWVGMWQCAVQCIWVNRDCLIAKQNEPRLSMVKYPLTSNYCSTCNKQSICIFVYNWLTYLQSIVVTLAKDCQKPILASVTHRLISVTFFPPLAAYSQSSSHCLHWCQRPEWFPIVNDR